ATSPVKIVVYPGNTASLPVWIADVFGYFRDEHLKVDYVSAASGIASQQAMVAGQADMIIGAVNQTASLRATGVDAVVVVGQFSVQPGILACGESIEIKSSGYPDSMKELVGKSIAITAVASGSDSWLRYTMIKAGVDPEKTKIIPVGALGSIIAALK